MFVYENLSSFSGRDLWDAPSAYPSQAQKCSWICVSQSTILYLIKQLLFSQNILKIYYLIIGKPSINDDERALDHSWWLWKVLYHLRNCKSSPLYYVIRIANNFWKLRVDFPLIFEQRILFDFFSLILFMMASNCKKNIHLLPMHQREDIIWMGHFAQIVKFPVSIYSSKLITGFIISI